MVIIIFLLENGFSAQYQLLGNPYTVKNGYRFSRPQPGCNYQTLPRWE
jgi:hypothetical protein